jgi:hypothetical protein
MTLSEQTPLSGDFEIQIVENPEPEMGGIERLYMPGEALFGVTGYSMRQNGWTVFPQSRDFSRKPAVVDGRTLKWGEYKDTPPSLETTKRWSDQAAGYNTAIVLGPPSGNTICLDIDVTDRELCWDIEELADEVLGKTPFRRVGAAPKLAMFYRFELVDDLPANRSYMLLEADGETKSPHMVEILSKGKPITSHGYHHRTGRYFQWIDKDPAQYGPEHATLITPGQLELFITRLNEIRKIQGFGERFDGPVDHGIIVEGAVNRPVLDLGRLPELVVENGKVVDGREKLLFMLAREACRINAGHCYSDDGRSTLKALVIEQYERLADYDHTRTSVTVKSELHSKIARLAADVREGKIKTYSPRSSTFSNQIAAADDTFGYLPTARRKTNVELSSSVSAAALELVTDRRETSDRVARELEQHLGEFLDAVYGQPSNDAWIVKAPTGAGKTTAAIRLIANDPRTYQYDGAEDPDQNPGPIVFLLPSYANIAEVRARADEYGVDRNASAESLKAELTARGVMLESEIEGRIAELTNEAGTAGSGLRTMVYRGKVAAGCKMAEKVSLLMSAGIGTSNLCHTTVRDEDGERIDEFCQFYHECPAIEQRKQIARSHIVFLPRSFLDLSIPKELSTVRAVIADESVWGLLTHDTTMPVTTLDRPRRQPALSKEERAAGLDPDFLLTLRDEACAVASQALFDGECPAAALQKYQRTTPSAVVIGAELVAAAKRVCGSAITSAAGITPSMSVFDLRELVQRPAGEHVKSEYRFWKIVEERIEQLVADAARLPGSIELARAKGDRDHRIAFADDGSGAGTVSLRWRSDPNWKTAPLLLLDASADAAIIKRVFRGRTVVERTITSDFNARVILVPDRAVAVSPLFPGADAELPAKVTAARGVDRIRQLVGKICAMHSDGRVAICLARKVRKLVCHRWMPPHNADFMHFGATAGLDFAKSHVAFVSIGRTELPTSSVDDKVAALTYDDETPEAAIDPLGTGVDRDGAKIALAKASLEVQLRDGRVGRLEIQRHAGPVAATVQRQTREEQILQFVGRARAVHRDDTAAIYIVGQIVPAGVVVDEIATWDDVLIDSQYWDAVRRAEMCLDAELLFRVSPEVATVQQYQAWISRLTARELKTFTRVVEGTFVAGFVPDPADHFNQVCARNGVSKSVDDVGPSSIKRSAAGRRPDDSIEIGLRSRSARREIENLWRDWHIAEAINSGKWLSPQAPRAKNFWSTISAGERDQAGLSLSLSAWQTLSSFDEPWLYDDNDVEIDESEAREIALRDEAA